MAKRSAKRKSPDARTSVAEKVRENRLRRVAARRGLLLEKSRRRDPLALDFRGYQLTDVTQKKVVYAGSGPDGWLTASLDDIERVLIKDRLTAGAQIVKAMREPGGAMKRRGWK